MHRNTKITFWYSTLFCSAEALAGVVVSNYLYALTRENFLVGLSAGASGIVQMLVAFPAGRWADHHSKSRMLRYGAVLTGIVILLTAVPLFMENTDQQKYSDRLMYLLITVSYVLWGVVGGYVDPPLDSLFANSLSDGGQRTRYNSRRSMLA